MAHFEPRGLGWHAALPDFRDYVPGSPQAHHWLKRLRDAGARPASRATSVDLSEYFLEADDQGPLNSSSAHACASLIEYFERRSHGRLLRPSRLFLYQNSLKLAGHSADCGADLRGTLKAAKRCGIPAERQWPYELERFAQEPPAFLYSFREPYNRLNYLRLDHRKAPPGDTLATVKSWLAAGFPSVFGFSVPNSLTDDGNIPYRPTFDSPIGGQALVAVGYDDSWLHGLRGALRVRSSWGSKWGDAGYGWLPYAFVEEGLAAEFWTLMHPDWLASGEFDLPQAPG